MPTKRGSVHSTVTEDYLKAIADAEEWGASGISVGELAERMHVRASTASENVTRLVDLGLVNHRPYQLVHLTDQGRSQALNMVRRHRILETYLYQCLDVDWGQVHQEAEVLEHAISDTLLERMDRALGHPTRDPHGHPIPAADGTWTVPPTRRLVEVEAGDSYTIARINDGDPAVLRALETYRLLPDQEIAVIAVNSGSVCVSVTGQPVTLTPEQAGSIFVHLSAIDDVSS